MSIFQTKKHQIKAFRTREGKKENNIDFFKYYFIIKNPHLLSFT